MEPRKKKEIEYYDKHAENCLKNYDRKGDFEGFEPQILESFKFLYKLLKDNCRAKLVLDYGCGNGVHSVYLAKMGAQKVIGIDLSEKSLQVAKEKIKREKIESRVEFLKMDCEKMEFPDNYFDVVFDGGTFSSIDLDRAWPELLRVIKPGGVLIGIETFGHNPLTNLKRRLNKFSGKRTEWAVNHIFKNKDILEAKKYFSDIKIFYFHPVSWLAFPFLRIPGGKLFLKFLEFVDKLLLELPFFRKCAFKVVFIFTK